MDEIEPVVSVRSPFDLPTHQKRLRHLKCVMIRNLQCTSYKISEIHKMVAYFTLHQDSQSEAVYTSEKIKGSLNPSWRCFDVGFFDDKIDAVSKFVVVKVWIGSETKSILLLDLQVNLDGLVFLTDKLQLDGVKYKPNTAIFGMFDKYFIDSDLNPSIKQQEKSDTREQEKAVKMLQVYLANQRRSYNSNSLSRIHTILRAVKQTQASVNRVHHHIEENLTAAQYVDKKLSEREELLLKITQLRTELTWKTTRLQQTKDKLDKKHGDNKTRDEKLTELRKELAANRKRLDEDKQTYNQHREHWIKESAQLLIRRKQLIGDLATSVFPIVENEKQDYFVCGVKLPNSESYQGHDEMMIAVALGNTCHLTLMISQILSLPLRYNMEFRGSRSLIRDHIHVKLTDKDRDFPLYGKGKEKFQFNYGVFLLNKNISQLRFYCGLGTSDLRLTLPNLKSLLELRLGVKGDHPSGRSITPSTSASHMTSAGREGARSTAGSSSASSATRQDQTALLHSLDSEINELQRQGSIEVSRMDRQFNEYVHNRFTTTTNKDDLENKNFLRADSADSDINSRLELLPNSPIVPSLVSTHNSNFSVNVSASDIHLENSSTEDSNSRATNGVTRDDLALHAGKVSSAILKDRTLSKASNSEEYVSSTEFS